ncbi:cytochrome c1 [Kiloniella sp. EL199]|uniref:cytochrome c1 n=1 Tax=Kiloniella sp. EL199 TaxID=2107581 RepID=UPI000EA18EB0|nr:cytochrome c1 [Kiloniella sp. EL199]
MKKILIGFYAAALSLTSSVALASGSLIEIPKQEWSFQGTFGSYDKASLQRGFQVYKDVCSGCHSLDLVAFRNLADLGYNEDEIKAIAAEYTVEDGPNDEGEMFERNAIPADRFPAPFPNEKAAAASNGGKAPPDLSLMAKARHGGSDGDGADYIYALLTGYTDAPEEVPASTQRQFTGLFDFLSYKLFATEEEKKPIMEPLELGDLSYNEYFSGYKIAMAPPLSEDAVEYSDGTPATVEQMSADVSHFLMWAAEPKLEARKNTGVKVMIFLIIFTLVMYAAKRKVFAKVH